MPLIKYPTPIHKFTIRDREGVRPQRSSWDIRPPAWMAIRCLACVFLAAGCSIGVKRAAVVPIPDAVGGQGGEVIFPNSEYTYAHNNPVYRVWYGTNRKPKDPFDHSRGFSGDRDDSLYYGTAIVSVPQSHKFGSIGSSWIYRLIHRTDDRLRVDLLVPRSDSQFFSFMSYKLSTRDAGKRTVLVYIHGYNTSFEEAAVRAAQIGFDLKIEGVTALFSWPSAGEVYQYTNDEATIAASEPCLEEFLNRVLRESGAEQVNIIAHSMGNRGLLRVMQSMAGSASFGQVILAAPDVDTQVFKNLAAVFPSVSTSTTMYVSEKDRALELSGWLHGYSRAGFTPPVTVVGDINTVEVSGIDLSTLGHRYFAEAAAVLYDMFQLLQGDVDPSERIRLSPARNSDNQLFYTIRH